MEVPDHCSKMNIAIKRVHRFFGFLVHRKVMFILLSIKCTVALCLKNVHILIKNTLLLKKAVYHLSLQQVIVIFFVISNIKNH